LLFQKGLAGMSGMILQNSAEPTYGIPIMNCKKANIGLKFV
jgi:hypothetical protein